MQIAKAPDMNIRRLCQRLLGLGSVAGRRGRFDSATEALNKGISWLNAGDLDSAIVARTEAIRLAPTRPDPHAGRAAAYRELGEEEKAVEDEREAQELGQ